MAEPLGTHELFHNRVKVVGVSSLNKVPRQHWCMDHMSQTFPQSCTRGTVLLSGDSFSSWSLWPCKSCWEAESNHIGQLYLTQEFLEEFCILFRGLVKAQFINLRRQLALLWIPMVCIAGTSLSLQQYLLLYGHGYIPHTLIAYMLNQSLKSKI